MTSKHFPLARLILSFFTALFSIALLVPAIRPLSVARSLSFRAQGEGKRHIEDKIPKHVPLKVKLKTEKESAFESLQNDNWLRDFQLEVTNTSDKPIYFLEIWADLPDVISENGRKVGFALRYGRIDFINFDTRPVPEDVRIAPGQSYTFVIAEKYQKIFESRMFREKRTAPRRVELKFVHLSFGDGSGFNGTDAMPYPYQRGTAAGPCYPPGDRWKGSSSITSQFLPAIATYSFLGSPALINLFLDSRDQAPLNLSSQRNGLP